LRCAPDEESDFYKEKGAYQTVLMLARERKMRSVPMLPIDYGLGYESREYNLTNSEYQTLEYIEPTK
jgi:hypothetical protein